MSARIVRRPPIDAALHEAFTPNLYFDRQLNRDAAKILPGEYYVSERDMVLVTVLGSCVAACVRDRLSGIGGMNHFMLPGAARDAGNLLGSSARYGVYAMELLINEVVKHGGQRGRLEAKVFGGGNVLAGMSAMNVGARNAEFVIEFLAREKIRVVAQDLNDFYARKVYFFPKTGRVRMKKLRRLHNDTILRREREYTAVLDRIEVGGEVELFT
ncbi:MAG: chemoreceptor glutamine deamidase CheD [Betaproteobacteria bacterium]|nr:chemoreceptor glutamine deamidase CheD [Betaproteobacteria bacterium]